MRIQVAMVAIALGAAGCVSQRPQARYSHPILADFTVDGVSAGQVTDFETAKKIATEYIRRFDISGSIQPKAETRNSWTFSAQAGDFVAVPVHDIVIAKDGSVISQGKGEPVVRLTLGKWTYDKRQDKRFVSGLE